MKTHERTRKSTTRRPRSETIDDARAFVFDSPLAAGFLSDEAEAIAEEFIAQATSAEDVGELVRDEIAEEELGGPFLERDVHVADGWFAHAPDDDESPAVLR